MPRFVQQAIQRGKVRVPFDQGRQGTEPPQRCGVKLPDWLRDTGTVIVNQNIDFFGGVMACEMDLADRVCRQSVEIRNRVEPEIPRANVDVVEIANYPAAGPASGFRQKFRLGER